MTLTTTFFSNFCLLISNLASIAGVISVAVISQKSGKNGKANPVPAPIIKTLSPG
jgi:hypothetical protein